MKHQYRLIRTNSTHSEFIRLVNLLDHFLADKNGLSNTFFTKYNNIELIDHVVVIYVGAEAVGCGALKEYDKGRLEIKRMYIDSHFRGRGLGSIVLSELLVWAQELGYEKCILETGRAMQEAIQLYRKNDFRVIPNYGPYVKVDSSICFEKAV